MLESEQSPSANPELQDAWNMFHFSAFVALGSSFRTLVCQRPKRLWCHITITKGFKEIGGEVTHVKSHGRSSLRLGFFHLIYTSVNQQGNGTSSFSIGNTSSKERSIFNCSVSFSEGMPQGYFLISTEIIPLKSITSGPFASVKWTNKMPWPWRNWMALHAVQRANGELINDF